MVSWCSIDKVVHGDHGEGIQKMPQSESQWYSDITGINITVKPLNTP